MKMANKEQKVLKQMGIPDFRHMTKDKVIQFVSSMDKLDPEVAKKAIEQFPEFSNMMQGALTDYKGTLETMVSSNEKLTMESFRIHEKSIDALIKQLDKPELSTEERIAVLETIKDINRQVYDETHAIRAFFCELANKHGTALAMCVVSGLAFLGVKAYIGSSDE